MIRHYPVVEGRRAGSGNMLLNGIRHKDMVDLFGTFDVSGQGIVGCAVKNVHQIGVGEKLIHVR